MAIYTYQQVAEFTILGITLLVILVLGIAAWCAS